MGAVERHGDWLLGQRVRKNRTVHRPEGLAAFGGRVDDTVTEREQRKGSLEDQGRNEPERKVWL